ncbi:DUF742 domain-containing protein [Streptomyces sp. NPDC057638]|uniref:DUF742 domain-containing protein n=1 Tax=Streptomyces sp. NPDC057638 TaxID=3346190 RepID=UPI00368CEB66
MTTPRRGRELVRAYVRTGGQTCPRREVDMAALLVASPEAKAADPSRSPEARAVLGLCWQGVLSPAELASYLALPLSVVLIVVGDLIDGGLLAVPAPAARPDESLLQEVLRGLRAL